LDATPTVLFLRKLGDRKNYEPIPRIHGRAGPTNWICGRHSGGSWTARGQPGVLKHLKEKESGRERLCGSITSAIEREIVMHDLISRDKGTRH